ncbi:hypothetical protein [Rhizobium arsenicireducens]
MSYFIAFKSLHGWKAIDRRLHPLPPIVKPPLKVFDADHEPGRSILKGRHGFA